jgi:hypothetical protein
MSLRLLSHAIYALAWASVCNFLPPMLITCSAMLNDPREPSRTMLLRCSTIWPSPIPCDHAMSTLLCTFATALTTAQSVSPVVFPSLALRHRRLSRRSPAPSGAPSSPKCPTSCVGNSVKNCFVASWSAIRLTPQGTASTTPRLAGSPVPSMSSSK